MKCSGTHHTLLYDDFKVKKTNYLIATAAVSTSSPLNPITPAYLWQTKKINVYNFIVSIKEYIETKLTLEELSTVWTQIEACLNSRPLVPLKTPDEYCFPALTLGHILASRQ